MKYPLTPHMGSIAHKHHTSGINNALTNDNTTAPIPTPKNFQNEEYFHQRIRIYLLYQLQYI